MPRQRLGQHFLIKGSILERIAAAACPGHEDLVIEIGPGRGALTEKLLKRSARVMAVELDPFLVDHLRTRFAGNPGFEVVHADVLRVDLGQWDRVPIAGNLPYYIASPILEQVIRLAVPRAVFLIQKEVADRLTATPGHREYGYLTVQTELFCSVRRLFDVAPGAFHPPPKVDSTVILLEPRDRGFQIRDREEFLRFLRACFHLKRKTLRNNLIDAYGKELIDTWPEAGLRAEQVHLEQFVEMFQRLDVR